MGISFIILSYNQSKNIIKILDSIRYAQLLDYEIILVDNNSTDFVFEKVRYYCVTYKINYKLINNTKQKNQSCSRNLGLQEATKEYVYFIDGDDYLNSYFLHSIELSEDVVFVPRVAKDFNSTIYKINQNNIENKIFYISPVNAFYKRDFLLKYNIKHEEEKYYYYSEDLVFACLLFNTILEYNIKYKYLDNDFLYFGIKRETSTPIKYLESYYSEMLKYLIDKINNIDVLDFLCKKIGGLIEECINSYNK